MLLMCTLSVCAMSYRDFAVGFGIVKSYTPNPYTVEWDDRDWAYVAAYMMYTADREGMDVEDVLKRLSPSVRVTDEPLEGQKADGAEGEAYCLTNYGGGSMRMPWLARALMPKEAEEHLTNYKRLESADGEGYPEAGVYYSYRLPESGRYINVVHTQAKGNFPEEETERLLEEATELYWTELTEPIVGHERYRQPMGNRYARLGTAVCLWNDVRHFYPHIEQHEAEWDARLAEFIALAVDTAVSGIEYYNGQRRLLGTIDDGHIALWNTIATGKGRMVATSSGQEYYLPVELDYVDGTLYVKNVAEGYGVRLRKWDVVKRIDGRAAEDVIRDGEAYVSAATDAARHYKAARGITSSEERGRRFVYEVEREGVEIVTDTLTADRTQPYRVKRERSTERLRNLGGGVLLYDASVKGDVSRKEIERMNGARAVIYDLRNGIDFGFERTLAHMGGELRMPKYPKVVTRRPFNIGAVEMEQPERIEPREPRLTARGVRAYFLSGHRLMSWGETVLQIVKGNGLGTIVGETSAGTNGNATRFYYPIYVLTMTGIRAYNADGSEMFGIGVQPDVEVRPTFDGVRSGRDEVLERVVEMAKEEMKGI